MLSDHDGPVSNFETNTGSFQRSSNRNSAQPPRPEMKRRVMDIEDVLCWAYRDELPKGLRSAGGLDNVGYPSVSPMFSMASMGARVDNWSREPGFPAAMGDPHPDALIVDAAVQKLSRFAGQAIENGLGLMADLAAFAVDEEAPMRKALAGAVSIVVRAAKSGRRPFWTKRTTYRGLHHDNGQPAVMAWQTLPSPIRDDLGGGTAHYEALVPVKAARDGRYPVGAHCVLEYGPDLQEIAQERAEYACWWAALETLAQDLTGQLTTIAVMAPTAAQRPWIEDAEGLKPPRVFADLSARVYLRQQRETAAAYRLLGQRRQMGERGGSSIRTAPRRTRLPEALTG